MRFTASTLLIAAGYVLRYMQGPGVSRWYGLLFALLLISGNTILQLYWSPTPRDDA